MSPLSLRTIRSAVWGTLLVGQDVILPSGEIAKETPGGEVPGSFGLFPFIDQKKPKALPEQVHDELGALGERNTPFVSGGPVIEARGGRAGFEQRTLVEGNIEASIVLGNSLRLGLAATPTEVSAGASDGSSELRLGLLPQGVAFDKLSASGIGFRGELATRTLGLWAGSTPQGFLVQNIVGGFRFRPANGPLTIIVSREPLKDTLLSYAGVRDPVSNQIFGGVVANSASVRVDFGNEKAGYYFGGGYSNCRVSTWKRTSATTAWPAATAASFPAPREDLNIGIFGLGLHYDNNLRYFTFGQGGYFSPQRYFLVGVPLTWRGVWQRRLQYSLSGSMGPAEFPGRCIALFPDQRTAPGARRSVLPRSFEHRSQLQSGFPLALPVQSQLVSGWSDQRQQRPELFIPVALFLPPVLADCPQSGAATPGCPAFPIGAAVNHSI